MLLLAALAAGLVVRAWRLGITVDEPSHLLSANLYWQGEDRLKPRDMPPLKRVKVVAPAYPADAQRGTTILELTVAPTGNVDRVDLIVSVKGASDAAIAAARQWVYEPLMRDGQAVWTVTVLSVPNPWSETSR